MFNFRKQSTEESIQPLKGMNSVQTRRSPQNRKVHEIAMFLGNPEYTSSNGNLFLDFYKELYFSLLIKQ